MLFSSLTFLFIFLPCVCLLYFLCKKRMYKSIILLIFSLVFYAWGEPKYILLMVLTISISYVFGLLIDKFNTKKNKTAKKITFITSVMVILSSLIFFKYTNFIFDNINSLFNSNIVINKIKIYLNNSRTLKKSFMKKNNLLKNLIMLNLII